MNQPSYLFEIDIPDTILYYQCTIFISQLSSVQIPTKLSARLIDLIKYLISPIHFLPLTN